MVPKEELLVERCAPCSERILKEREKPKAPDRSGAHLAGGYRQGVSSKSFSEIFACKLHRLYLLRFQSLLSLCHSGLFPLALLHARASPPFARLETAENCFPHLSA